MIALPETLPRFPLAQQRLTTARSGNAHALHPKGFSRVPLFHRAPASPTTDKSPADHWRVDRRIPLALIFAVVVQTLGAFWWAAQISANMSALRDRVVALPSVAVADQGRQMAAIDAKLSATQESIKEMKSIVMDMMRGATLPTRGGRDR
jgi:hypothetical protein